MHHFDQKTLSRHCLSHGVDIAPCGDASISMCKHSFWKKDENDEIFTMTLILFSFSSFTGFSIFFFFFFCLVVLLFVVFLRGKVTKNCCILLPLIDASLSLSYY